MVSPLPASAAALSPQGVVVAIAATLCLVGNLSHIFGVGLLRYFDITPFTVMTAALVLVLGVLRYGLMELVPVARDAVVERMSDAVVVLDRYRRVVDLNAAARTLLGTAADSGVGEPVGALLPGAGRVLDHAESDADGRGECGWPPPVRTSARLSGLHTRRDAGLRGPGPAHVTAPQADEERLSGWPRGHPHRAGEPHRALPPALGRWSAHATRAPSPLFCDVDRFSASNDRGPQVATARSSVAARLTGSAAGTGARLRRRFVVLVADPPAPLADHPPRVATPSGTAARGRPRCTSR